MDRSFIYIYTSGGLKPPGRPSRSRIDSLIENNVTDSTWQVVASARLPVFSVVDVTDLFLADCLQVIYNVLVISIDPPECP